MYWPSGENATEQTKFLCPINGPIVMNRLTTPSNKSQGFTRRVLKTTDHNEECKNTKGQYYDQDLQHYEQEVEQINDDELAMVEQRGEVPNGQVLGTVYHIAPVYIHFTSMYLFGIINSN